MPNNKNTDCANIIFDPKTFHLHQLIRRSQSLIYTSRRVTLHVEASHFQLALVELELNRLQRKIAAEKRAALQVALLARAESV